MSHLRAHVQNIDHHWSDGHYTLVGGGSQPSGPAALGCTGECEELRRRTPTLAHDVLHGIHCPRGTLHHWQEQWPVSIACLQVLAEGMRDQCILPELEHGLEGHLTYYGHRSANGFGESREQHCFARQLR